MPTAVDPPGLDAGADLVAFLDLDPVGDGLWAGPDALWSGPAPGGLLAGQCLVAAVRTRPGRRPWTVQVLFTRAVGPGAPCDFAVEVVQDGRSVSVARVTATQDGDLRALALVTLGEDDRPADAGPQRRPAVPPVAPPERSTDWEALRRQATPGERRPSPVEIRVDPTGAGDADGATRSHAWVRLGHDLPADPTVHAAAVAFATDLTLLRSTVRPERSPWTIGRAVTLNHTVWFHQPPTWTGWLLYATACPTASAGRAQATGTVFLGDDPVATTHQDGLVRW